MTPTRPWVMLPSAWIRYGGLREFRWTKDGGGSASTMALMILIIIAHHADMDSGEARITYEQIEHLTDKSRSKISAGLKMLGEKGLIFSYTKKRSSYTLTGYDRNKGWAALPARNLYDQNGSIPMFKNFRLRSQAELNALKIYLLLAAYRDRERNATNLGFKKISELTGIDKTQIRLGKGHLLNFGLMHVDPVTDSDRGDFSFEYRLFGLFPRKHGGSTGKSETKVSPA